MERTLKCNRIGNKNIIPSNFKFIHLKEKIELVLNADA